MSIDTQEPTTRGRGAPDDPIWPLSLEQYHQMIRAGILTEDDPVELLEGRLVRKMSKNPPHRRAKRRLLHALGRIVPGGWYVEEQEPISIAASPSEPEPDVFIARGSDDDYIDRNPGPADLALVVEIADSSLAIDRGTKKGIYAGAAIPAYWIVNIPGRRIEVYSDPTGPSATPDYRSRRDYGEAEEIPLVLDGREVGRVAVRDVLP